jgi:hypothetical protein
VGRRADLRSAARGTHDAGESRVAIRGAGSAAGGDQHALAIPEKQWSAGDCPALPLVVDQRARLRQLEVLSLLASKQQPCGSTATSGVHNFA